MNTIEFEKFYVILPAGKSARREMVFAEGYTDSEGVMCEYGFHYESGDNKEFLSVADIQKLIKYDMNK